MRRADFRSIAFVVLAIACVILPFVLAPLTWPVAIACFCGNVLLSFICTLVTHNHIHCPTFRSARVNRAFELMLTIARGSTVTGMIIPHIVNHHPHNGSEHDWIRCELAGQGWYPVRVARFTKRALKNVAREKGRPGAPKLSEVKQRHLLQEKIVIYTLSAFLLWWNPVIALTLVGLPWITALLMLLAVTMPQHEDCDPTSMYDHSRNFTSRVSNWFFMNNGFHTVHHLFPEMHWSELPAFHSKVAAEISPHLNERALSAHIMRRIFTPSSRTGSLQANSR